MRLSVPSISFVSLIAAVAIGCESGTAPEPAPPPPASLAASPASTTEVLLTWTASAQEVEEFQIARASETGPFLPIGTVPGNVTSFRDVGLVPGTLYRYRVTACGEGGCSVAAEPTVTTHALLVITTTALANGVKGVAYNGGVSAEGGADGYTWMLDEGSLPAGLALSERGIISGVPTTLQTAIFTVKVRSGDGQTASKELALTVVSQPATSDVTVQTPKLAPGVRGMSYGVKLDATGGDGANYTWRVVQGALPAGVLLGFDGVFTGSPTQIGTYPFTVRASSAGDSDDQAYALTVVPHDQTRFNLTPFEVVSVTAAIRPHLDAAFARWQEVVVGELPSGEIPPGFFSGTFCGGFGELVNGTSVDDLLVMIDISPIDGRGKILGQAGSCGLRGAGGLPFVGTLTLDQDDLTPLVGTETLTDLIFHEIGHVLGFGGLWDARGFVTGGGTTAPVYTGTRGVAEWRALGGTGSVPLENQGGEGTADTHWSEARFRTEVMTGFVERVGVAQPLSRVSIASLADLGYTVNMEAADPYTLPAQAPAGASAQAEAMGWDELLEGPVKVLTGGGLSEASSP